MPTLLIHSSTTSGVTSRFTPRASSTSALPHWLETLRLPCLATLSPPPAATKAVVVETLKVWVPSPPVPQVSTIVSWSTLISSLSTLIALSVTRIGVALARITLAAPVISEIVSPFMRSAVINAPICASVALPSIISSMTPIISSSERSSPCTAF